MHLLKTSEMNTHTTIIRKIVHVLANKKELKKKLPGMQI